METHTLDAADFSGLKISGAYNIVFRQSPDYSVTLEIQGNLFRYVEASVSQGVFTLDSSRNFNTTSGNTPRLVISAPDLNSLVITGAASANITLDTNALGIDIAGAASLTLTGTVNTLTVNASGAANVNAFEMKATHASVVVAGAGNIDVYASETLDVRITGAGRVRYDGDAELNRYVTGLGVITRRN
jgi:hypothetical protein